MLVAVSEAWHGSSSADAAELVDPMASARAAGLRCVRPVSGNPAEAGRKGVHRRGERRPDHARRGDHSTDQAARHLSLRSPDRSSSNPRRTIPARDGRREKGLHPSRDRCLPFGRTQATARKMTPIHTSCRRKSGICWRYWGRRPERYRALRMR